MDGVDTDGFLSEPGVPGPIYGSESLFLLRVIFTNCNHNQFCPERPLKFPRLNFFRCPEQSFLVIKFHLEIFVFRIICMYYVHDMLFWWRQFRLLTNNLGCYAKEFLRKGLLLPADARCVWQTYIYVMVGGGGEDLEEDIIRTDTICPPRSSLHSGGAIDGGIDGTCVLSNPFYTVTHVYLIIHIHTLLYT